MTTLDYIRLRTTRARFGVVAFIVGLAMVTYLDRACIGTMTPQIRNDLHLDERQMSWVFSAFAIAYAAFEIPTAWAVQRRGTRAALMRIVLWWSVFTLATAAVATPEFLGRLSGAEGSPAAEPGTTQPALVGTLPWVLSFTMMLLVRFLFGVGEAGAWPCAAASYARWIPARERGIAQGMLFAGAHLSGGLTPLLVVALMKYAGLPWRVVLLMFACVGLAWAAGWYYWYRDDPAQHRGVGPDELRAIESGRRPHANTLRGMAYWRRVLTNPNVLFLCAMYIGNSYAFYFCITWLPTFVKEKHHLESNQMAIAAGLPLALSVLGDIFGGLTTDWMTQHLGARVGRSMLGAACYGLAALGMVGAIVATHPWVAIGMLSFSVACVMFTLGAAWGTVIDISGEHTGIVGAVMNTAGNTAAIFSPIVAIYVKDTFGSWNAPLFVIGGLFAVGAVAWCFTDPRKHVFGDLEDSARGAFPVITADDPAGK